MRILFDQGAPIPLKPLLSGHHVETAFERGWATLSNGDLLAVAEGQFDVLITTDKNLRLQQSLGGKKLSVLVLPTTSWPRLRLLASLSSRHPFIRRLLRRTRLGPYELDPST